MGFKTATEALAQAADSMRDQGMDARKIGLFIGVLAALPDAMLTGDMVFMIGGAKDKLTSIALENVAPEECETLLRAYECEQKFCGMDIEEAFADGVEWALKRLNERPWSCHVLYKSSNDTDL